MKIVIPDWSTMSAVNMGFSVFEEFGEVVCCGTTKPEEAAAKPTVIGSSAYAVKTDANRLITMTSNTQTRVFFIIDLLLNDSQSGD